jgi:hypothetical protein
MATASFDSGFGPQPASGFSQVRTVLIEPLLMVAVAAFWLVALPFVAVSLVCVKIWDALVTMKSGIAAPRNPLFLRRGVDAQIAPTISRRKPAPAGTV